MLAVLFCFGMTVLMFANANPDENQLLFILNVGVGVWYAYCGAVAGWQRARQTDND